MTDGKVMEDRRKTAMAYQALLKDPFNMTRHAEFLSAAAIADESKKNFMATLIDEDIRRIRCIKCIGGQ